MLRWNPQKRPTAQQALRYSFFQVGQNMQRSKVQMNKQLLPAKEYTIDKKPNVFQEAKPLDLNASQPKKTTALPFKSHILDDSKKPEPPKNNKTVTPRRRWGGGNQQAVKPGVKDSVDEFESILDGLGNSTSNFSANKRVSQFL